MSSLNLMWLSIALFIGSTATFLSSYTVLNVPISPILLTGALFTIFEANRIAAGERSE